MREKLPNHWQCLARIGQLPPHQHHQGKTEEQKKQPGESVLDADDFMVGGENVFSPPSEFVMIVVGLWIVMSRCRGKRSGSVHFRRKLSFQYLERSAICKARNSGKSR